MITRPDEYNHANDTLAFTDSENVRGGLKQVSTFNNTQLAALNEDELKAGNPLYAIDTGLFYKLDDLANYDVTSGWSQVGLELLDEDDMASDSDTQPASQQSVKAYVDNGDQKISQTFTNIADTNFTIDFNSEDFTINRHITSITADRTCTVSNAVNGSQFVIDVSIASGQVNHELIFSGPSSPTIIPGYINGTSNGVAFPGNASAATKYTVIGWYNGTEWRINVIDWN